MRNFFGILWIRALALTALLLTPLISVPAAPPNAWQVSDTSGAIGANYRTNLLAPEQATALAMGWRYSIHARFVDDFNGTATMVFLYGVGTNRFSIFWDLDANNDLIATPFNQPAITLTTNGNGTNLYHTHDIIYDPATRRASYLFDGIQRTTWDGDDVTAANGLITWGSGSSAGQGIMNFHTATFAIASNVVASYDAGTEGTPVPDPQSQGWSATGLAAGTTNAVSPDPVPLPSALVATTLAASSVQPNEAVLPGTVDLGGLAALAWMEWGATTNYGNTSVPQFLKAGPATASLSLVLDGLTAGLTYHFRCVATNLLGTAYGQDVEFTTPPWMVTTLANSGAGSLRQTILDAASGDIITLATNGTIRLAGSQIEIAKNLTIIGPGPANLRIDGARNSRIFTVLSGVTGSISGITITNGQPPNRGTDAAGNGLKGFDGGGIHNAGTLVFSNCVIIANSSGNGGHGTVLESYDGGAGGDSGHGGGIYNAGILTLLDCIVANNFAGFGGYGAHASGTLFYAGSGGRGGDGGHGGGIHNVGSLMLSNCTVSGNFAGYGEEGGEGLEGGGFAFVGGNGGGGGHGGSGGGIYSNGPFTAVDSLIYDNYTGRGGRGADGGGFDPVRAEGGDGGSGGNSGSGGGCFLDEPATFSGSEIGKNGIHATIAAGGTGGVGTPAGQNGASGQRGSGGGIYNRADSTFAECGFTFNMALNGGGIFVTSSTLTLDDCSLNNNSATNGGGIYAGSGSTLMLTNCSLDGNSAASLGGGVYGSTGGLTLYDCHLNGNSAREGGGIYNLADSTFRRCFFTLNRAELGGAINGHFGTLRFNDCGLHSNSAISGGGVLNLDATINMAGSVFSGNWATNRGGAVDNYGTLTLTNCNVSDNFARFGGGIHNVDNGTATLNGSVLSDNHASANGGAIHNSIGTLTLDRSMVFSNSASNVGGAIANYNSAITINRSTLALNTASFGGGIYNENSGFVTITNSTLSGNTAGDRGGGVNNGTGGLFALHNTTLSANQAGAVAGGIENSGSSFVMTNTIVAGNTAPSGANVSGPFSGANNLISGDPRLAVLGNYGGPTPTMPPLPGSPAIDAGSDSVTNSLVTDQRGFRRRAGASVDLGAVEMQVANPNNPPVLNQPALLPDGALHLSFTNDPANIFSIYASTNLALPLGQWTRLGTAFQPSPGQFQYTDSTTANYLQRFYTVTCP